MLASTVLRWRASHAVVTCANASTKKAENVWSSQNMRVRVQSEHQYQNDCLYEKRPAASCEVLCRESLAKARYITFGTRKGAGRSSHLQFAEFEATVAGGEGGFPQLVEPPQIDALPQGLHRVRALIRLVRCVALCQPGKRLGCLRLPSPVTTQQLQKLKLP